MTSSGGVASTGGGLSESDGAADGGSAEMSSGGATGGVADNGSGGIANTGGATNDAVVVSSEGLGGVDQFHFDAAGVRTLGQRYGAAMAQALGLTP